ncbi:MAG: hypothetical protein AAF466_03435 [Bacteroidota bacterium]
MKKSNLLVVFLLFLLCFSCSKSNDDGDNPQPDANCLSPSIVRTFILATEAQVAYETVGAVSIELEYGAPGFTRGTGMVVSRTISDSAIIVRDLEPMTTYEYYLTSICSPTSFSAPVGPRNFTTQQCRTPGSFRLDFVEDSRAWFFWSIENSRFFELEYGVEGFSLGNGMTKRVEGASTTIGNLDPSTTYDIYLSAVCGSSLSAPNGPVTFTTDSACPSPQFFKLLDVGSDFVYIIWDSNESAFEVEYGPIGFTIGTGTVIPTSNQDLVVDGLQPSTTYEFYVRANCGGSQGLSNNVGPLVATTNP